METILNFLNGDIMAVITTSIVAISGGFFFLYRIARGIGVLLKVGQEEGQRQIYTEILNEMKTINSRMAALEAKAYLDAKVNATNPVLSQEIKNAYANIVENGKYDVRTLNFQNTETSSPVEKFVDTVDQAIEDVADITNTITKIQSWK